MNIQQKKDMYEILSFVKNHRKKQEEDLLNSWINFSKEKTQKTVSFVK